MERYGGHGNLTNYGFITDDKIKIFLDFIYDVAV
jgi:hypothetical protein